MKVLGEENKCGKEAQFSQNKTKLRLSKYRFLDTIPYFSLSVKLHYRKANCGFLTKIRGKNKKKITDLQVQSFAIKGDEENFSFPGSKRQAHLLKYSSC